MFVSQLHSCLHIQITFLIISIDRFDLLASFYCALPLFNNTAISITMGFCSLSCTYAKSFRTASSCDVLRYIHQEKSKVLTITAAVAAMANKDTTPCRRRRRKCNNNTKEKHIVNIAAVALVAKL